MDARAAHPWVASLKGKLGFGLQAVAAHSKGDPGAAIIRAENHAERYGFDAFFSVITQPGRLNAGFTCP